MSQPKLTELPWLHVYGQFCWHSEAAIVGTKNGLVALRDAISKAIDTGSGTAEAFATDGEGYAIEVRRSIRSSMGEPQYAIYGLRAKIDEMRRDHERIRKIRPAPPAPAKRLDDGTANGERE